MACELGKRTHPGVISTVSYLNDATVSSNFLDNTCDSSFHLSRQNENKIDRKDYSSNIMVSIY
jgi:hypothetical protein